MKTSILAEWLGAYSSVQTLPIINDDFTTVNMNWEEIDNFENREFIISAGEIPWEENEDSILDRIDQKIEKESEKKNKSKLDRFLWKISKQIHSAIKEESFESKEISECIRKNINWISSRINFIEWTESEIINLMTEWLEENN